MSTLTENASSPAATAAVNRRILPFVLVVTLCNYISRTNLEYAALQLNSELHLNAAAYGTAAGLYFLGFGVFMLPSSFMSVRQRSGRSWWFGVITSSWGVISMLHCTARKPVHLDILRVALGAAQAGGTTSTWHVISQFYPSSRRGLPMAVYVLGQVCAMAVAPPISAAILQYMSAGQQGLSGWQWLYLIEGIPSVLLGFAMVAWLPVSPLTFNQLTKQQQEDLHSEIHGSAEAAEAAKYPPTWKQLPSYVNRSLRTVSLLYFSLLGFLWMFCMSSLFYWVPLIADNILEEIGRRKKLSTGGTLNITTDSTGSGSSNTSSSDSAAAAHADTPQQITAALLATTVPYVGAAVATVLVAWLMSRKSNKAPPTTTTSSSSSSSSQGTASGTRGATFDESNHCGNNNKAAKHLHATHMFYMAGLLVVGAIPLLCFVPAYQAHPIAAFAMLCVALITGFPANSIMVAEASKTVPASTAGVGLVIFNLAVALGGLVGPTIVGQLVQRLGGFKWAVFMVGVGLAVSAAVAAARGAYELAGHRQAAATGLRSLQCCQSAAVQPGKDAELFEVELRVCVGGERSASESPSQMVTGEAGALQTKVVRESLATTTSDV